MVCTKWTLYICRKDVSLPQDMQRAMAAEAEATREANAKVRHFHPCPTNLYHCISLPCI